MLPCVGGHDRLAGVRKVLHQGDQVRRIAGVFCLAIMACSSSVARAQDRPNILFAFADDWGRHASAYVVTDGPGTENDLVQTPNFDALAASGVLFKNAFVNAPSCTPCRSSILAGMHFWQTNTASILQGAVWDDSLPAWPLGSPGKSGRRAGLKTHPTDVKPTRLPLRVAVSMGFPRP